MKDTRPATTFSSETVTRLWNPTGQATHKFVIILSKMLEPGTALNASVHPAANACCSC